MNDPHVTRLVYRLKTGEDCSYEDTPPLKVERPEFDATLEGGVLTVTMREHHPTVASAMERVGGFLRAWEIHVALEKGRGRLSFEFDRPEVIDRNPPPPGTVVQAGATCALCWVDTFAVAKIISPRYPEPPTNLAATEKVQHVFERYKRYLDGKDLLTTMRFTCLTLLTRSYGKNNPRVKVAAKYRIDKKVLDELAYLTSDVGDVFAARKFDENSTKRPHTAAEVQWIEAAVKILIRRVAEHEYDPTAALAQITMSDLPAL
jgi:hypothetical protein